MIVGLDHIAIAVTDIEVAIRRFVEDFGLTLEGTEDVISAQTKTAFLPIKGTRIELIHPIDGQGAVQKFLDKRGGGMHHLCFETDDIIADMRKLKRLGYHILSDSPQPGAHDSKVVFVHPKSTGGVLIELVEHTKELD